MNFLGHGAQRCQVKALVSQFMAQDDVVGARALGKLAGDVDDRRGRDARGHGQTLALQVGLIENQFRLHPVLKQAQPLTGGKPALCLRLRDLAYRLRMVDDQRAVRDHDPVADIPGRARSAAQAEQHEQRHEGSRREGHGCGL